MTTAQLINAFDEALRSAYQGQDQFRILCERERALHSDLLKNGPAFYRGKVYSMGIGSAFSVLVTHDVRVVEG